MHEIAGNTARWFEPAQSGRDHGAMAIRDFTVGPLRSVRRAAASDLGNLVVLAGPNGSGKSTVLELLRQNRHVVAEPGTQVMFVGPHRTWRSSSLNRVAMYGFPLESYGALLASDQLPSYQYYIPPGLQGVAGTVRDAGSAEEAPAFVKTSVGKLRDKQQRQVTAAFDAHGGQVPPGVVPDLLQPFRRLITTLLPHLDWVGVDDSNENDIQILFQPAGEQGPVFDIDQLSSGEKAAIALLLPLVERQTDQLAAPAWIDPGIVSLTMLLDEPEIHLHPLLQLQVLQYMRTLAAEGAAQFILSTHSPTLLDALDDDELYLVSPATLRPDNQLSRLTTSHERLEVARELTGSTHLLTRAKPIVFLEGEEERSGISSDTRLVSSLLPDTRSWALVPGRSKREVTTAVQRLRQEGLDLPGTPVFGIVDADSDKSTSSPYVLSWPVAMVENLLLDAEAIYGALAPFGAQTAAKSVAAVQAVLEHTAASRTTEEVRLRIQRQLPLGRLTLQPDQMDSASSVAEAESAEWLRRLAELDLDQLQQAARIEVAAIEQADTRLDRFHGKKILQATYDALQVNQAGVGRPAFTLMVATQEAALARAARLASSTLVRIRLFFPAGLVARLRVMGAQDLAARCQAEEDAWTAGGPKAEGRLALRAQLFNYAQELQDETARSSFLGIAAQIGTP